jgi:phosphoribosylformimino-5-aminoimidazole carboxamide ribotide isomerase
MNLPRVGSSQGPDLTQLAYFQKSFPQKTFIAAGGIRNKADLDDLERIGIKYALVATALHNGSISGLT